MARTRARRLRPMRIPLTDTFGLDTMCFVCDPTNGRGLRIPYAWDTDERAVVASTRLGVEHSGVPGLVHGGVIAAIVDECVAWTAIAAARHFAATAELRLSYLAPVPTGDELAVWGRLIGRHRSQLWVIAEVRVGETLSVRAEARCRVIGDELPAVGTTTSAATAPPRLGSLSG